MLPYHIPIDTVRYSKDDGNGQRTRDREHLRLSIYSRLSCKIWCHSLSPSLLSFLPLPRLSIGQLSFRYFPDSFFHFWKLWIQSPIDFLSESRSSLQWFILFAGCFHSFFSSIPTLRLTMSKRIGIRKKWTRWEVFLPFPKIILDLLYSWV